MDYTKMTYNQFKRLFEQGRLDVYDVFDEYKKARRAVGKQIREIEQSDVPFVSQEKPSFKQPSQIQNSYELLHEFAAINEFRQSGFYTVKARRNMRNKALDTMREHGMTFVNEQNYSVFGQFMTWFRANSLNKLYGSQEDVIENFFSENWEELSETPQSEWMELFEEYVEGLV